MYNWGQTGYTTGKVYTDSSGYYYVQPRAKTTSGEDNNMTATDTIYEASSSTISAIGTFTHRFYFNGSNGIRCFTEDTWIDIWDEKRKKRIRKRAKDVKYSDKLLVWNFDKGCFDWARPLFIQKSTKAEEFTRIHFSDGGYLDIVGAHSMYRVDLPGFKNVMNERFMPIGAQVFKNDGSVVTITGKENIKRNVTYTNIITYYHMNVFTNGILTSTPMNNVYWIDENMKYKVDDRHLVDKSLIDGVPEEWIKGLRLDLKPDEVIRNIIAHTPGCHNMREWLEINKFNIQKPKE